MTNISQAWYCFVQQFSTNLDPQTTQMNRDIHPKNPTHDSRIPIEEPMSTQERGDPTRELATLPSLAAKHHTQRPTNRIKNPGPRLQSMVSNLGTQPWNPAPHLRIKYPTSGASHNNPWLLVPYHIVKKLYHIENTCKMVLHESELELLDLW